MAIDIDDFMSLYEAEDPVKNVREVFGVPEPGLKPRTLKWKGQTVVVYDYELFKGIIQDWMRRYGQTKEEALDEFFSMG